MMFSRVSIFLLMLINFNTIGGVCVIPLTDNRITVDGYVYNAVVSQTDDTPLITADMSVINPDSVPCDWIAISRDLHKRYTPGAPFDFGDTVLLFSNNICGRYVIRDIKNKRFNNSIDFLSNDTLGKWIGIKICKI